MMKEGKMAGACQGEGNLITRFFSKLAPPVISVLPIPGEEVFRSNHVFFSDLGLEVAANPRAANVMIIRGPVPVNLNQHIIITYAQMPRPRVLIFDGLEQLPGLPHPDLKLEQEEAGYLGLKKTLEKLLTHPFAADVEPYAPEVIEKQLEQDQESQQGHQHHHHGHDHSGHQHEHEEHHQESDQDQHQSEHQHHSGRQEEEDHDHHDHSDHSSTEEEEHEHQHSGHDQHQEHEKHDGHDHGGHGGGMGFMSMVMMTKDMPRSMDGLPMEHNQAHFGPFFPGLTGGISVQMMLDGDTAMQIKPELHLMQRKNDLPPLKDMSELPQRLTQCNPLCPETWKVMGELLLNPAHELTFHQVQRLETERIDAHFNWLITFSTLTGNQWLRLKAEKLMKHKNYREQKETIRKFTDKILKFRHLKHKIQAVGSVPDHLLHHTRGIVARAAGQARDARIGSERYRKLGFEPVLGGQNDVWGRLKQILAEINQSLELLRRTYEEANQEVPSPGPVDKIHPAQAELESPFGLLIGNLEVKKRKHYKVSIKASSGCHLVLAGKAIHQLELSDALVSLASFHINPWEVNKIEIKNTGHA